MKKFMMFSLMILAFSFTMVGCLDDTKKETPVDPVVVPKVDKHILFYMETSSPTYPMYAIVSVGAVQTIYPTAGNYQTYEVTIPVGTPDTVLSIIVMNPSNNISTITCSIEQVNEDGSDTVLATATKSVNGETNSSACQVTINNL